MSLALVGRGLIFLIAAVSTVLAGCGGATSTKPEAGPVPGAFSDRDASGESIANAWFELLSRTGSATGSLDASTKKATEDVALVKPYLDSAFQLQRADGQRYTKESYVPADIDEFEIKDVSVTEPRADIKVLRYATRTPGETTPDSSMVMSDQLAPRLTAVRWDKDLGHWVIVSHANFNTPVQAVCDQEPIQLTSEQVTTSAEDRTLGEQLVRRWFDLLIAGDGSPLMHPAVQGQTASGTGYTTSKGYVRGQMKSAELSDFVVTRNGDLIVVTLDVKAEDTVHANSIRLGTNNTPRLLTFLQDDQQNWKMIATATFNPPATIPADVQCARAPK